MRRKLPVKTEQNPRRGQAFVELMLMTPIIILLMAGMVEVVFTFNDYLQMLDGARNGARDSSDINPYPLNSSSYDTNTDCTATQFYFRQAACTTEIFLKPVDVRAEGYGPTGAPSAGCISPLTESENFWSDIVISVFTTALIDVDDDSDPDTDPVPEVELKRFDNAVYNSGSPYLVEDTDESGWSFIRDQDPDDTARGMCSAFTTADIRSALLGNTDASLAAPNSGYLVIEVFYRHYQLFDVPGFGDVISNPIHLRAYAIFSLSAAEATATPLSPS